MNFILVLFEVKKIIDFRLWYDKLRFLKGIEVVMGENRDFLDILFI